MIGEQGLLKTDLRLLKWEIDYVLSQMNRDKEYEVYRLKALTKNLSATIEEAEVEERKQRKEERVPA